ncbi:hypothetical protein C1645_832724 [Glomus cerebriforme]|uniref:DNA-directed DNA polymerase family B exonuclease domain-containing protein n=1 Tax=Glomus cerebriforme TaxID=658196 RepID=A0A397SGW1_9GLOM|nr:hypothetical protein C1645_832724 [Glomus cerebriforme]
MPTEVSDDTSEYVNGVSSYILRITGTLVNGQKAVVKITGIKPFFDVEVPEEMPLSTFKTRLAIREVGIRTASDDLNCQYYYRKVAREERLPLSSWVILNDYNNPLFSSALSRDRTLVLTWDIETYSSRKIGEVPNAKYEEDVVFMIGMTVHWKDDPEPLKQICLHLHYVGDI